MSQKPKSQYFVYSSRLALLPLSILSVPLHNGKPPTLSFNLNRSYSSFIALSTYGERPGKQFDGQCFSDRGEIKLNQIWYNCFSVWGEIKLNQIKFKCFSDRGEIQPKEKCLGACGFDAQQEKHPWGLSADIWSTHEQIHFNLTFVSGQKLN